MKHLFPWPWALFFLAMGSFSRGPNAVSAAEPATLRVTFTLTDHDDRPLPGAEVRLVLGTTRGWQSATAGTRFTTDAMGAHTFELASPVEARATKRPTNFVDSLFRRAEPVDFLQVAAELDFGGVRRLYVTEIHRFHSDGNLMLSGFSAFAPDTGGEFTDKIKKADDWTQPDYKVADFKLSPEQDAAGRKHWRLSLVFRRAPLPVRR